MSAIILPLQTEIVFPAMKIFGNYNMIFAAFLAVIAVTIGSLANYGIGELINIASNKYREGKLEESTVKISQFLNGRGKFLLLFSWVPLIGAILLMIAGFCKVKIKTVFLFIFVTNIFYYLARVYY
ncbi:hypothetical protein N9W34_00840 [Rickettsiales bacterium]|nr:hypothetical protein [Rickettsiales bacterium]